MESVLDLAARPAHAAGVVAVPIDGETVVVDEDGATLHHLDGVATAVWLLLDGRTSLGDASATLAARFGTPVDQVTADVRALVTRLVDQGLLVLP